ncbi:MAG: hypothetical protein LBU88_03340 [Treponema sp.]|jgi:hypothetical protein|nr:hypothetical protein [Treponema sp.]
MKRIWFIIYFFIFTSSLFGQQFLWSTVRDTAERYVPLNNVTREVLNIYDIHGIMIILVLVKIDLLQILIMVLMIGNGFMKLKN